MGRLGGDYFFGGSINDMLVGNVGHICVLGIVVFIKIVW